MSHSDLLESDVYIAGLLGKVEQRPGYRIVRTPENPGFYFGNLLVLDKAPEKFEHWLNVFEREFDSEVRHRCIAWEGKALSAAQLGRAKALQLERSSLVELTMTSLPPDSSKQQGQWTARALRPDADWTAIAELFSVCKSLGVEQDETFRLFNERTLMSRQQWLARGLATWWGVFEGEQLVGQCGMVFCGEVGRFQDVETHPEFRRRGICSALLRAVAKYALGKAKVSRLVLAAEVDGPALSLYRRLGFCETGRSQALFSHASELHIRSERSPDHAGVRSLVRAAFGSSEQEVELVDALRKEPGALSLVAVRSGQLLGHVLFSSVVLQGAHGSADVAALAPFAVRPEAQGQGVGSQLVTAGLDRCREAGYRLCTVLGAAEYYGRFGFVPAVPRGISNPFAEADEHFLVKELRPGALQGHRGNLNYGPHFAKWVKPSSPQPG